MDPSNIQPIMYQPAPASAVPQMPTPPITIQNTQVSYAGFWRRVGASIFDGAVISFVVALIGFLYFWFFVRGDLSQIGNIQTVTSIASLIIWIIYFPFVESRGGATLGKKLVGIKVTKVNGEPVSFLRALGRNLAKIISVVIFMIGFIMAAFTEKKQGLHDMIAGCVVVKTKYVGAGKLVLIIALVFVIWGAIVGLAGVQLFSTLFSAFNGISSDIGNVSLSTNFDENNTVEDNSSGTTSDSSADNSFVVVTAKEYDAIMAKPIKSLDSSEFSGPHTNAGPALIDFDQSMFLNVAVPVIPNLQDKKEYVWIDLTSGLTKAGKDIIDHASDFETDTFFSGLNLSKRSDSLTSNSDPIDYLFDFRSIHTLSGTKVSSIIKISGVLHFKIPLGSAESTTFYEKSYPFVIDTTKK